MLTPADGDLTRLLKRSSNANGLGEHGRVYVDLRILEATRRLIDEYPQWRIPEMNRELGDEPGAGERATHPAALDDITQEMSKEWQEHAIRVRGEQIADVTAGLSHMDFALAVLPIYRIPEAEMRLHS